MKGNRKLIFGLVGLVFLAGGLLLTSLHPHAGQVGYPEFATGVVGIVVAVVVGNVGEHLAAAKKGAGA